MAQLANALEDNPFHATELKQYIDYIKQVVEHEDEEMEDEGIKEKQ
ncbi:MAG: hypothetical protein RR386_06970 [Bacteroidaceae bacterium]